MLLIIMSYEFRTIYNTKQELIMSPACFTIILKGKFYFIKLKGLFNTDKYLNIMLQCLIMIAHALSWYYLRLTIVHFRKF